MADPLEVKVPDIGDFDDVPVIEVHGGARRHGRRRGPARHARVRQGDDGRPVARGGTISELKVAVGDTVSEGTVLLILDGAAADGAGDADGGEPKEQVEAAAAPTPRRARRPGAAAGGTSTIEVKVPDIGDFADVPVIEVMVSPGDTVAEEDPLVTLESDKATMDVPSPAAGTIRELKLSVGDTVSEGTLILTLEAAGAAGNGGPPAGGSGEGRPLPSVPAPPVEGTADHHADVVVLGAGPGGYTAAFRAADLGLDGRPDRALRAARRRLPERRLHPVQGAAARRAGDRRGRGAARAGDLVRRAGDRRRRRCAAGRTASSRELTGGLDGPGQAAQGRGRPRPRRSSPRRTSCASRARGRRRPSRSSTASSPPARSAVRLPGLPDDPRIIDSTGALELDDIPERLLVVGGGIIGLEMATVYDALGSPVTVVELLDQLIPGADKDLVRPLQKRITGRYEAIHLKTGVASVEARGGRAARRRSGDKAPEPQTFDRVLVAVGRRPNGAADRRRGGGRRASTSAASSPSTARCAPTCRTSTRSATSSASRCSPTRPRTRARSRPRSSPATTRASTRGRSRRSPTPTPRSRGSA